MRTFTRMTLAGVGAAALALGGLAIGVAPASAALTPTTCSSGPGDALTLTTATGVWYEVCLSSGVTADALTAHKSDAFDNFGELYVRWNTADEVTLAADDLPLVEELPGDELVISWADRDVQWAVGDLIDVYVEKRIKGSTQSWTFTILDSDDDTPRNDVTIDIVGNLGSDGAIDWSFDEIALIAWGDVNDPILIMKPHGGGGTGSALEPGTEENVNFWAVGSGSGIDVGLVDYTCENYDEAIDYATSIASTIDTLYGQTLVTPGSSPCLTAPSPIYLTTGAAFTVPIQATFGPEFDFSQGGELANFYDNLEFVDDFEYPGFNEAGVVPGLVMTGTAPTTPGTYFLMLRGESYVNDVADQALVLVIVEPPKLAATGLELSPAVGFVALALVLAGATGVLIARRRTS